MLDQYDRLRKRNAFMDMYKKEKMFEDSLEEFDIARYVIYVWFFFVAGTSRQPPLYTRATCDDLMKEYRLCKSPDYISYVRHSTQNCGVYWLLYEWSEFGGLARTRLYCPFSHYSYLPCRGSSYISDFLSEKMQPPAGASLKYPAARSVILNGSFRCWRIHLHMRIILYSCINLTLYLCQQLYVSITDSQTHAAWWTL